MINTDLIRQFADDVDKYGDDAYKYWEFKHPSGDKWINPSDNGFFAPFDGYERRRKEDEKPLKYGALVIVSNDMEGWFIAEFMKMSNGRYRVYVIGEGDSEHFKHAERLTKDNVEKAIDTHNRFSR